jgi:hypothetical protein
MPRVAGVIAGSDGGVVPRFGPAARRAVDEGVTGGMRLAGVRT